MLNIVAAVGGGLFVLVSLVVGGRLMWMARTTRGVPEFVLGAALFTMGGLSYPLATASIQATGLSDTARATMLALHMLLNAVGMCGIGWFTRHVFRPGAGWSLALWASIGIAYLGLIAWQVLGPGLVAYVDDPIANPWHRQVLVGIVAMSWAGIESMLYHDRMRKRLSLGLADPVVVDRFRLWAIGILLADSISLSSLLFEAYGLEMASSPIGSLLIGVLGLMASAAFALAFWPPKSYLARIQQRSAG